MEAMGLLKQLVNNAHSVRMAVKEDRYGRTGRPIGEVDFCVLIVGQIFWLIFR